MFIDKVNIICKAGAGGDGKVSFRREKYAPNGGPDGGDGGNGGDVIFKATTNLSNLVDFRYTKKFFADEGIAGSKKNSHGKKAEHLTVLVPVGTVIKNTKTGKVIADLHEKDKTFVALRGGRGGRGNARFATPVRQAPNFAEKGEKTDEFELTLELKTIADVGLVGFPNVGKSTILASISNAKPKIANYHFTTLSPNIGVVKHNSATSVWADIPGLIEGASKGVGLGHEFLRHIERTRLLVHVIDASGSEGRDPFEDYLTINQELANYGDVVKNIPQIIALNKLDLVQDEKALANLKQKLSKNNAVFEISAAAHIGLDALIEHVVEKLKTLPKLQELQIEEEQIDRKNKKEYTVEFVDGAYVAYGYLIDEITKGTNIADSYSNAYFQKRLKDEGVIEAMLNLGLQEGDTVRINEYEFEYVE